MLRFLVMRWPLVVLVPLLFACAPRASEPEPLELETVEVGAPVDATLSTEADEKGRPPGDEGWILTGMLPEDLPLHRPARLVDAGETPAGGRYFVFHTSSRLADVRAGLERALPAAGWTASATDGDLMAAKGGERVGFFFSELRPGTEIRVEH